MSLFITRLVSVLRRPVRLRFRPDLARLTGSRQSGVARARRSGMPFRFIHTADWQIGKPFGNFPGDAGVRAESRSASGGRDASRRWRAQQAVDAVLVAGDAFDANTCRTARSSRRWTPCAAFAGPWVFLPGNHDAALTHGVWTRLRAMGAARQRRRSPTSRRRSTSGTAAPSCCRRRCGAGARPGPDPWFDAAAVARGR